MKLLNDLHAAADAADHDAIRKLERRCNAELEVHDGATGQALAAGAVIARTRNPQPGMYTALARACVLGLEEQKKARRAKKKTTKKKTRKPE